MVALSPLRFTWKGFHEQESTSKWVVLTDSRIKIKDWSIVILATSLAIHLALCRPIHRAYTWHYSRDTVKSTWDWTVWIFKGRKWSWVSLASFSWSGKAFLRIKAYMLALYSMYIKESSHKTSVLIKAGKWNVSLEKQSYLFSQHSSL